MHSLTTIQKTNAAESARQFKAKLTEARPLTDVEFAEIVDDIPRCNDPGYYHPVKAEARMIEHLVRLTQAVNHTRRNAP